MRLFALAVLGLVACRGGDAPPITQAPTASVASVDAGAPPATESEPSAAPLATLGTPPPNTADAKPSAEVKIDAVQVVPPNGARVLAGLRPRFRQCASKAGATSSTLKVTFVVAPQGDVKSYSLAGTVPKEMKDCVADLMRKVQFDATPAASTNSFEIEVQ